ncbi:MAG: type VI secretion system tube protein Hcp [Deltaproteobacteria bacterium]|nr:MAG: type VI secretion system tube protein Hcp [Deltaproteobacteria bacterium]
MADNKNDPPETGANIVQRLRFRVVTSDDRQLVSHVATVTRPAPKTKTPPMSDVPVHLILVAATGQKQGALKIDPGFKDMAGQAAVHQFSIQEFSYSIVSQRDPQSGLPTGQRMHKPVVFAKELGPSTPQLYAALANNENLSEVIFDCYGTQSGVPVLAHSVKLINAGVAEIDYRQLNTRDPASSKIPEFALVSLTFQSIEWTHGAIVAADSWENG